MFIRQRVQDIEPNIVPGARILDTNITQTGYQELCCHNKIAKTRLNTNRASTKKEFIFWPQQAWQPHRQPQEPQQRRQQAWRRQHPPPREHPPQEPQ
jgi:hypothetical protein